MIPLVKPFLPPADELMPALQETLYSGYIAEGEKVKEFEHAFGEYIGNPSCLSLNSGTAALHIALIMCGVGPGDEVISTALTAEPTNVAIKMTGAKVIWADVDLETGLISPESVRTRINERTKAILLVHYAGMVCDMNAFLSISKEFNIPLIEDAAHALGSKFKGKMIGNFSPFTIFSLQAIKHITTIDGGMLLVKDKEAHDLGRIIRWFGLDKTKGRLENNITIQGYKYHMNNVNATVGLMQMKYIEQIISSFITNGKNYDQLMKGIPGIKPLIYYSETEPSYWLYTLKAKNKEGLMRKLAENGIMASELHVRNDRHSIFAESKKELPNLDAFYNELLHLPCGWWLKEGDVERIAEVIKSGW